MHLKLLAFSVSAWAVLVGSNTFAQTTRPAPVSDGPTLVSQLASAVTTTDRNTTVDPFLADNVVIHRFGHDDLESVARLHDRAAGKNAIVARAYLGSPSTLATDLSGDFRDATVPDALKRLMIPSTSADLEHANQIAADWITSTLQPAATDVVGIIVLDMNQPGQECSASPAAPLFILFKAQPTTDARLSIQLIVYGDPRE